MPHRPALTRAPIDLVERRAELAAVGAALDRVPEEGQVVVIRGIAGIGKTSLLDHAAALARDRGWTVRVARGDDLEADFAFGVVLQLLEGTAAQHGAELFEGPAGLARPLLTPGDDPLPDDAALFSILHGVYWFAANLADRGPLVLVVDDAHWADLASLRWLHYLAKRISEHPIALVLGCRPVTDESAGRILGSLPVHTLLEPRPLSAEGVAEVVRSTRPDVAPAQVGRWHDLTGGVPLFVRELLRVGDALHSADAAVDESLQTVRARLDRLEPSARLLVEAAAVLGDGAPIWQAERLAGIAPGDDATRRALVDAAILDDDLDVCFTHPAVREAVERSIAPTEARRLHGAAVALLVEADSSPELVAHHLMASPPGTSPHAVDVLERAARRARLTGSPEQAAAWVRRALAEAPAEPARARLLAELAVVDATSGDDRWEESVERAVQAAPSAVDRADVRLRVGRALGGRGWLDRAAEVLRAALD
ncbi:MAG: ATP-binding protein, partial [Actinomycetota bacterium]